MANVKITGLTSASVLTSDDLFPIVNDPLGVPVTQKITAQVLLNYITGSTFTGLTLNSSSVIDVSTTNAALRVTQRGTGESIRVEDSTNPDTTPFVVDAAGNVGIGTSSPTKKLHVTGSDALINTITVGLGNNNITTNTAIGNLALNANIDGNNNVALGTNALANNTAGIQNTAIGSNSLYLNQSGGLNTAVGYLALSNLNNLSSGNNTAIGMSALQSNQEAANTAVGRTAMQFNINGARNSAVGMNALRNNIAGNDNAVFGYAALQNNISGSYNVAIGPTAGGSLSDSANASLNIFVGTAAGQNLITGSNNVFLGYNAGAGITNISDTFILTLGSNERMRIDSAGNVGIATTTPTHRLDVNGNIALTGSVEINRPDQGEVLNSYNSSTAGNDKQFYIKHAFANVELGNKRTGGNIFIMSGSVGIGTTAPNFTLAITGTLGVSGNTTITSISGTQAQFTGLTGTYTAPLGLVGTPSYTFVGDPNTGIYSPAADTFGISTGGTEALRITANNEVSASGTSGRFVTQLGTVGAPSYTFVNDPNTGIYSPSADTIAFVEGGTEVLRIDSAGRVGIGTSSPVRLLNVSGTSAAGVDVVLVESTNPVLAISSPNLSTYYSAIRLGTAGGNWFLSNGKSTGSASTSGDVYLARTQDGTDIRFRFARDSGAPSAGGLGIINSTNQHESIFLNSSGNSYIFSGNLGIGTTSPNFSLAVTGTLGVSGNTTIANGNLIIGTTGKGIDFSATPNSGTTTPAELFDDYEEGTWSPSLSGTTTAGTFVYNTNTTGSYTKVGNIVNISCYLQVNSTTTALTGTVNINGLPFLVQNQIYSACPSGVGIYVVSASLSSLSFLPVQNTSRINLYRTVGSSSSLNQLFTGSAANELSNTPLFQFSGIYFTDQ